MKPKNYKKVLIAVDYDPSSLKVTKTGYWLAKEIDAEVTLLHVIADATYYSSLQYSRIDGFENYIDLSKLQLENEDGLKEVSQNYLNKIKHKLDDETIKTLIKEGDFATSILNAANDLKVDLIVIGSHSRRWLEKILLGSVTEKVLQHSTIPLFIVPTRKKE